MKRHCQGVPTFASIFTLGGYTTLIKNNNKLENYHNHFFYYSYYNFQLWTNQFTECLFFVIHRCLKLNFSHH